jgi:hypothetical protein
MTLYVLRGKMVRGVSTRSIHRRGSICARDEWCAPGHDVEGRVDLESPRAVESSGAGRNRNALKNSYRRVCR